MEIFIITHFLFLVEARFYATVSFVKITVRTKNIMAKTDKAIMSFNIIAIPNPLESRVLRPSMA